MANTSSAKKAQRRSERQRVFNARRKKAIKDALKGMEKLIASAKGGSASGGKGASVALPTLYKAIDKAAKNGTIHANTAARMKSRAAKQLRALSA